LKTYEGMFLLSSVESKRDMEAATSHVTDLLKKHQAEPGTNYLWDERKLAYEIHQQKRGTYYLVYFKCPPENVAALRRDCELSEIIIRQLILAWEGEIPPMPTEEELARHRAELSAASQPGYRA
jgi:small subunit ribosomal protein S6